MYVESKLFDGTRIVVYYPHGHMSQEDAEICSIVRVDADKKCIPDKFEIYHSMPYLPESIRDAIFYQYSDILDKDYYIECEERKETIC
jgi:hypothetical protein